MVICMIMDFDEYQDLVCEDVPRVQLRSIYEDVDIDKDVVDPWDGVKPYAKDGFVEKYCKEC